MPGQGIAPDGGRHRVEQLGQRDRRRPGHAGDGVGARVEQQEFLTRRHHGVEQQLPVLAARITFTEKRITGQHVVAVHAHAPREDLVVEAEENDHTVRHRPHRHHRAHRQLARAEVRAGGAAREPGGQHGAHVRQSQDRVAAVLHRRPEFSSRLRELPRVGGADVDEEVERPGERARPVGDRLRPAEPAQRDVEPVDEFGQPPGEVDVVAVDVVERQRQGEPFAFGLVGRGAEQDAVERGGERVLREFAETECGALPRPDSPAGARRGRPLPDPFEVVVAEPEPPAHRRGRRQVQDLTRRHPRVGEFEESRHHGENRIGLVQGTIREPDPKAMAGMPEHVLPERGPDQRGVRLDVGAHDEHVARFESRIVLEEMQEAFAQDLHLAGRSVAGVNLDGRVGRALGERGRPVVPDVRLQAPQQGVAGRRPLVVEVVDVEAGQPRLEFADVPRQARQQRVGDGQRAVVVGACENAACRRQRRPHGRTRMRKPQVHITIDGEGGEDGDLIGREARRTEQRQSGGEFDEVRFRAQPGAGGVEPLGGSGAADLLAQPPPQFGLPEKVVVEWTTRTVGVAATGPVDQHRRPLCGVTAEQIGQVGRGRVAPARPVIVRVAVRDTVPEVFREDGTPGLTETVVDDAEQRPQHPGRVPWVVVGGHPGGGGEALVDEPGRGREVDVGGHPVADVGPGTERGRESLGEPALHPLRRDGDDLPGERIGQRGREHVAESRRESGGTLGAMQYEHVASLRSPTPVGSDLPHPTDSGGPLRR